MSTLKTGALRGTSGTADSIQLHASNQSVTFPGNVTCSGTATGFGKVLQVISERSTTSTNISDDWSATPANIGPTISITPSATNSKIIVCWTGGVSLAAGSNANKIGIVALENTTNGTLFGTMRIGASLGGTTEDFFMNVSIIACDTTHNSTSAQTYQLAAGRYSSTYNNNIYLGDGVPTTDEQQELVAIEIAG